jgi:hypothetical protein
LGTRFSLHLLASILVLAILLLPIIPASATPVYTAGVALGQWARYTPLKVTYSTSLPVPQIVKDLEQTVESTVTVQQVLDSQANVTLQSVSQLTDATVKTTILNGNLMTGAGNLSYALIAGGLSSPNPIWTKPLSPSINRTISMSYLGISRTVNVSNFTMPTPTPLGETTSRQEYVWDQMSGIILEAKVLVFLSILGPLAGFVLYTDVRVNATDIFSNPYSTPGFTITATTPASVDSGKTATSTIAISPINGFTGTVSLSDAIPSGLTCSAITPSRVVGSGTASLSCRSANPATYTVSIAGASDTTTRTTTLTITVTRAPAQTPNIPATILGLAPVVFYSIIGIAATIVAATLLALRTKSGRMRETARPISILPSSQKK